jgi:hypothetical protein
MVLAEQYCDSSYSTLNLPSLYNSNMFTKFHQLLLHLWRCMAYRSTSLINSADCNCQITWTTSHWFSTEPLPVSWCYSPWPMPHIFEIIFLQSIHCIIVFTTLDNPHSNKETMWTAIDLISTQSWTFHTGKGPLSIIDSYVSCTWLSWEADEINT